MLDLPHAEIAAQFHPAYSLVDAQPFNPALAWVLPLKGDALTTFALAEPQIEEFGRMEANWDGYGSLPIDSSTKHNSLASLRSILLYAPAPDITPTPNGTLSFEWETEHGVAHLEIGHTKISFYLVPSNGSSIVIDANASDLLLTSINIGILISAHLFPLQHRTTSVTQIRLAANVSSPY